MSLFKKNDTMWKFSPIQNIEEFNFNRILERFYGLGVRGLVKENIQNSIDGRLVNSSLPVIVKIRTGDIKCSDIPGIREIHDHINSLEGRNSYTKETIEHMRKKLNQNTVRYISFEDINTKGLTGAKNGQSNSREDTWGIYAYSKGVHFEESDSELEITRGGSHGVGKIASNAASDLHIMFFANCDEYGDQYLGGTVQLIEHMYQNQFYRSTGYFTDQKKENGSYKFYPYSNNFHSVFEKKTRGLKIIIPYLREEYDNQDEIIRAICDSFFVSIIEKKLEVDVNGHIISANTIADYITNSRYYEQDIANMKKEFTPLYYSTYTNEEPKNIVISNGVKDFNFKLYFKYNEKIPKGRVAIVRTIGMKIEDFSVKSNATKPFNAVLIGGIEEDAYLKSLEDESHTSISHEYIKDPILKKQARRFINKLSSEIANLINEEMRRNNPTDGKLDTKDLLYLVENQFKQDLESSYNAVEINNGKHIVKSTTDIPKTKKERIKKEKNHKEINQKEKKEVQYKNLVKKHRRKNNRTINSNDETEVPSEIYTVSPTIVERVLMKDHEYIQFNFKGIEAMKGAKSINLSFKLIDGMGIEYEDEFKISENYESIIDTNLNTKLIFDDKTIQKISIKNGIAKLKLLLKPGFNRALKFVYYVEV